MPIRRGRTHTGPARGIGEGEARRTLFRNQFERGIHQGFFQVAMVIAAGGVAAFAPSHVNRFYIKAGAASMPATSLVCALPAGDFRTKLDRRAARLRS